MRNIVINNLGKKYKRYPSNWARLAEWLTGGQYCIHEDRWALRGMSFEVESGEAVGIVGQNGAGKSTLAKAILNMIPFKSGNIYFH